MIVDYFPTCYLNGRNFAEYRKNLDTRIGVDWLSIGETGTYTVAFIVDTSKLDYGSLYFVPDTSIGQEIGAAYLTYWALLLN